MTLVVITLIKGSHRRNLMFVEKLDLACFRESQHTGVREIVAKKHDYYIITDCRPMDVEIIMIATRSYQYEPEFDRLSR